MLSAGQSLSGRVLVTGEPVTSADSPPMPSV